MNAAAVDILKVSQASAPVPQVSMSGRFRGLTLTDRSRITVAKLTSSSTDSRFVRSAASRAPTWAFVALPSISSAITSAASSRLRSSRPVTFRRASTIMPVLLPCLRLNDRHFCWRIGIQIASAVRRYGHDILDSNAKSSRQIDAGLIAEAHSGFELLSVSFDDVGRLMR